MLTGIATVSLSGSLEEKIDAIAAAGFDGLEIFENDLLACPLTPGEIQERCAERMLSIDLYQPIRDLDGQTGERWQANLRRAEAKFALTAELGAPTILMCATVQPDAIDDDDLIVSQLRELGDLAATYDVRIAYEALAWSTHVNTYEHTWRLVERADHPNVGLCLDSFHILSVGSSVETIAHIPGDKIFFCQLADAPALSLDPLSWSRHYRVFPGQGSFDLTEFVASLVAADYQGPLSIEVFNDVFRQTDPATTAVDALRSLRYLQECVRNAGVPDDEHRLVRLTKAQPVHAWDFVELVVGDAAPLARALTGLGLSDHGRHQRKPVSLWSRNDVRLILNHEPTTSTARLAAVGFQVRDPEAWVRRADQLLVPEDYRGTGPGEEALRAVVAPEGTSILVSAATEGAPRWLSEFPQASAGESAITGVDHVSLSQPAASVDASVLFARSVLGLGPRSRVDVADPRGLVRSHVLESADGGVRLVLNVLPEVLAGAEHGHAEHIAFSSSDIFHTVAALQAAEVPLLPIPSNYYADLRARFGLDRRYVDRLAEHHLLYDEDGSGRFLQVYTEDFGEVFLEVVERQGGYRGFGALNAPIRRAAQRRALAPADEC